FEVPVLFYAVAAFVLITRNVDLTMFVLAWVFVLTRAVQIFIHLSLGRTMVRAIAFGVGIIAVFAMWVIFAIRVIGVGF
ncbi:MAG: MAPEG family protein, partial [Pseudomonadota bacterium]